MADDGAELSLDDYIKVKRKQGAFKIGRGRRVKVQVQGRNRKQNRIATKNIRQQQPRAGNQVTPNKIRRGRGRGRGGGAGRGRYFGNVDTAHVIVSQRGTQRKGRGRVYRNWTSGHQIVPLMANNFLRGQRRYQNQKTRGYGPSQNLVRQARQRLNASVVQLHPRNDLRAIGRFNNRRAVQKLARKRVQRARFQLAKQRKVVFRPETSIRSGVGSLMPLFSVTSGIRRTRSGFVTVSNPVEKQIQRLVVKEKIQKARQIRIFNQTSNGHSNAHKQNRPRQQTQQPRQQTQQPRHQIMPLIGMGRNYNYAPQQQRIAPNHQVRLRNDPQPRASLNHNRRSIPEMGMSMYADQEESQRMQIMHNMVPFMNTRPQQQQPQWIAPHPPSPPFAIRRTMVNNVYDPTNPAMDYDMPHGLNPDIQRKINFIQNHGNRSASDQRGSSGHREIIPDFRAPVSSSAMKLGDRFKMYMQ